MFLTDLAHRPDAQGNGLANHSTGAAHAVRSCSRLRDQLPDICSVRCSPSCSTVHNQAVLAVPPDLHRTTRTAFTDIYAMVQPQQDCGGSVAW